MTNVRKKPAFSSKKLSKFLYCMFMNNSNFCDRSREQLVRVGCCRSSGNYCTRDSGVIDSQFNGSSSECLGCKQIKDLLLRSGMLSGSIVE